MTHWQTVMAVDVDAKACEVYQVKFPGAEVICAKVSDVLGQLPKADVIIGGPPCQSFSTAGGKGRVKVFFRFSLTTARGGSRMVSEIVV